jgi:hypothetical protein
MFIKSIITYIYISSAFLSLLYIYLIKCKYKNNNLNKFFYIDYNNENNIYIFYIVTCIFFYILGIICGIRNIKIIFLKIIIYDIILYIIKYCDITDIDINNDKFKKNLIGMINTILISMIFYYLGTLISNNFYNNYFGLNNKFNISLKIYKK